MKPGDRRSGPAGTIEIEEGPFTVSEHAYRGRHGARGPRRIEQVRIVGITGEMAGEKRQWAVSWVEQNFPTVR